MRISGWSSDVCSSDLTSVAVSEGIILYNPDRDKVRLVAGKGIEARDGDRTPPVVRDVDVANVGGWRSGLLVYNGTPLSVVAEDLKRTAGMRDIGRASCRERVCQYV